MRPRQRLRGAVLAVATAGVVNGALAACGALGGGTTGAGCVGPYLDDQPPDGEHSAPVPTVRPGETITVHGHWYRATCHDTGQEGPERPLPPVRLVLTLPGGREVPVGEFTPSGPDLGFEAEVRVPPGTRPGTAIVTDDRSYPATYAFEVGRRGADGGS